MLIFFATWNVAFAVAPTAAVARALTQTASVIRNRVISRSSGARYTPLAAPKDYGARKTCPQRVAIASRHGTGGKRVNPAMGTARPRLPQKTAQIRPPHAWH